MAELHLVIGPLFFPSQSPAKPSFGIYLSFSSNADKELA
jgi:hypothetical protein